MAHEKRALVVIDLQNDYFPEGAFPLWHAEETLTQVERAIAQANARGIPVVLVQHVARGTSGGFLVENTTGVEIHPRIRAAAPDAPVVEKAFADGFWKTQLDDTLQRLGVESLLVCGMMTQNCVTHTAISKTAERYAVTVLPDCCTTVSEIIHKIAIGALSTRVSLVPSTEALGELAV
ncbi:cysteine hydrolase family protein [Pararobbsia silviterrae]|uniref:Cysteine hydrolase n=1 Tax=Pararobbsia silviterrae TaxID=1792498 RepID=A0A494XMB3_9BURK|nr:cysteine hydrolase family protein [Pararobbsia silviterrae]RKP51830.1 cysteine hydrolase [Pararobbsia silviterrae]